MMDSVSGRLGRAETPLPILDLPRVEENARRVAAYCAGKGISWRPHVKTHKSLRIAALQLASGACGLTVAHPPVAFTAANVQNLLTFLLIIRPIL